MPTLEEIRKSKGYTQAALAEALGVDQSTVCLWEKGKTCPRAEIAYRLAELLGCTLDEVFQAAKRT